MRPHPALTLYDGRGQRVVLSRELGRGGEGSVFAIAGGSKSVAKIYHQQPGPEKAAKLAAMVRLANERLLKLAAWPTSTVHSGPNGPVFGFMMPLISGYKAAFNLYSPKLRLQEFPSAGWPFLIHAAGNAARAFRLVHECGHVVGDVNHGNLVIGDNATVRLIDCDSFQVSAEGRRWLCEVGVSTHQPPELQGLSSYKGVLRTPNHDNFGLAVIIFQLLFMARHPFSGRYLGQGDMPLERAIKEYRFAYSSNAISKQMMAPPGSLGLDGVPKGLALLFERAFSPAGSSTDGRPRPDDWIVGLKELASQLRKCSANPGHEYYGGLAACPWCQIEVAGGFALFPVVLAPSGSADAFNIAALWQRIQTVPDPGPAPEPPSPKQQPTSASHYAKRLGREVWFRRLLAVLLGVGDVFILPRLDLGEVTVWAMLALGALAVAIATAGIRERRERYKEAARTARQHWSALVEQWRREASNEPFVQQRASLERLKAEHDRLPHERLRRLNELEANRQASQLRSFLDRCRIDQAKIKGIGEAKTAVLQSHGIETALDIVDHRVLAVPGFGATMLKRLKEWRWQQERRFVFDPTKGADPAEKAAIERDILHTKTRIERSLAQGAAQVSATSQKITACRKALAAELERASHALAQAEADAKRVW